jgi:hypothetical protein
MGRGPNSQPPGWEVLWGHVLYENYPALESKLSGVLFDQTQALGVLQAKLVWFVYKNLVE